MKVSTAINRINTVKPSAYTTEDMLSWLSSLDRSIYREVVQYHEGMGIKEPAEYTDADLDKELLVQEPYADLYLRWLESKIDYSNAEMARYANSYAMFNASYKAWCDYVNRTYLPAQPNYVRI